MIGACRLLAVMTAAAVITLAGRAAYGDDTWLSWTASRAEAVGRAAYVRGRVGGFFDTRLLKTERSYNYKLAATWMTPEAVRATARLEQLHRRLTDDATRGLVHAAEAAGDTVVIVEIDPREGAGVIPNDWMAFLQFDDGSPVAGVNVPTLREVPALAGVMRRNYDYDRFWMTFPLVEQNGASLVPPGAAHATLIVRIHDKEGRVTWPVPASVHQRARLRSPSAGR